jgi:hypothetical protein
MSSSPSVRTVSLNEVTVGSRPTHIVIYQESNEHMFTPPASQKNPFEAEMKELRERVAHLEKYIENLDTDSVAQTKPSPFFHSQISGPIGLEVRRLEEPPLTVATVFETLVRSVRATPALVPQVAPELPQPITLTSVANESADEEEEEEKEQQQEEEQEEEEQEEEQEEEEQEEEEEQQEEEEESMELTEFEYKGATYYRDAENQVYQKDDDGDVDDDPIGVWNEAKQKVLKYPKK